MTDNKRLQNLTLQKNEEKKKKLKHVQVYDTLYEQMQSGIYPVGSQLPSEIALAEEMGVSRMTLRKALALFVDDGVIKNVPGVGHFVCSSQSPYNRKSDNPPKKHPIYAYSTRIPQETDFDFRIEPPTQAIQDNLQQYTPAVVIADRWYKRDGKPFAYSLSFLPIEQIAKKQIDLNSPEQLLHYLEERCYEESGNCHRVCTYSTTGNFTAHNVILSEHDSFLLIQETIYDEKGIILLTNKHYIPSESFLLEITL